MADRLLRRRYAGALAVAGLLLAGCAPNDAGQAVQVADQVDDGRHGAVLDTPYRVPRTPLTDTTGAPYSLAADTDKPLTLVFFGYTHCPDVCQQVMASIAGALTRLTEEQRARVDVVFVTTDPARDDRRTLRHYLDRFDPSFVGLTGDLATITRVAAGLKVFVERGERLPSGGYEVAHGTPVIGITADDRAPIVWTEGTPATDLAEDVAGLLAG